MVDVRQWSDLQGLLFNARQLVDGLYAGRHLSPLPGTGMDFHDYRQYVPGDNPSQIDWKLFGRTDRYFIRRYRHHTDLNVHLLVDVSASMDFAGLNASGKLQKDAISKFDYARTLAAALAFLTVRQGDRVGLGLFAHKLLRDLPPRGSQAQCNLACEQLHDAKIVHGQTDLIGSIRQQHARMKRSGLLILISDLLKPANDLSNALGILHHDRIETIVFHVMTKQEIDLRNMGPGRYRFIDSETRLTVGSNVSKIKQNYQQQMKTHIDALRATCLAHDADYNLLTTDQPVMAALRRYLVRRQGQ